MVICLHSCIRCMSSFATVSNLREPSVLTSSTFCSKCRVRFSSLPLSQSTSDHRRAKHSEMRRPKHAYQSDCPEGFFQSRAQLLELLDSETARFRDSLCGFFHHYKLDRIPGRL